MLTIRSRGLGLLLAGSVAVGSVQAQVMIPAQPFVTAPLVLRGITVIDVRAGRRLRNQQVEIVGNRIHRIGPAARARVPQGARVVDARGKFLIPGLWDMHSHAYGFIDLAFLLYLANGVTGIRDLGSAIPLDTLGALKREIVAGRRMGPRLIVSGPFLSGGSSDQGKYQFRTVGDSTPAGIRRLVDSLHAAGADLIKARELNRPDLYFAAAAETRQLGMRFGGHGITDGGSSALISGLTLSDSGATLLDHEPWLPVNLCGGPWGQESLNVTRCAEVGRHFRRNGTWIVLTPGTLSHPTSAVDRLRYAPTMLTPTSVSASALSADSMIALRRQQLSQAPEFGSVPPTSTAAWRVYWRQVKATYPSGYFERWRAFIRFLPLVLGTDVGPHASLWATQIPGFGVHQVLLAEVLAGMLPLEALRTATLNPAFALRLSDSLGTVEIGKVADLVVLDADPLADIWNTTKIRAVIANGRYYDRAALDSVLAEAEHVARRPSR